MSLFDDADDEVLRLDPEVVEDDCELAAVVDALVQHDVLAQQRLSEINGLNAVLRNLVDHDVWRLLLEIEARSNERWADLLLVIARRGFTEGQRHPRPQDDRS